MLLLKTNIWDLLPSVLFLKATNQNSCFHYIRPFISEGESKCIKMRLCSINFDRLLHWFITLWFINPLKVTLMPKQRYPHQLWGMWSSMWLMKINAKSHLVIENDSNSSVANLSRVADSTDIADLIRRHISEAKSISKQPANTPLWIKARADLQIPITSLALTAKYTTRGRQTGRRTGGQTKRMEKQERSGLKYQKNLGESKCTWEKKKLPLKRREGVWVVKAREGRWADGGTHVWQSHQVIPVSQTFQHLYTSKLVCMNYTCRLQQK